MEPRSFSLWVGQSLRNCNPARSSYNGCLEFQGRQGPNIPVTFMSSALLGGSQWICWCSPVPPADIIRLSDNTRSSGSWALHRGPTGTQPEGIRRILSGSPWAFQDDMTDIFGTQSLNLGVWCPILFTFCWCFTQGIGLFSLLILWNSVAV